MPVRKQAATRRVQSSGGFLLSCRIVPAGERRLLTDTSVLYLGFRNEETFERFHNLCAKEAMKTDLELSLVHDGRQWVVSNDNLVAKGEEFEALDADLKRVLLESSTFLPGERVTVHMGFDFDTIPTWLRQYHTHYFNRIVTVDL